MKHQITLWALVWMVSMSATAQNVTDEMDPGKFEVDGVFYTLDGRELSGRPTVGGIYIVCPANGSQQGTKARKVIVK